MYVAGQVKSSQVESMQAGAGRRVLCWSAGMNDLERTNYAYNYPRVMNVYQ